MIKEVTLVSARSDLLLPPSTFRAGIKAATPIVLGYLPIGFAFGVLARTAGLSPAEVALMSLLVYAGSGQFICVDMLAAGAAAPAIITTTFLINLRHLLLGTVIMPSLKANKPWQNALLAHEITDETFAVNVATLQGQPIGTAWVAGLHITAHSSWFVATVAGSLAGNLAANQEALGLDFALSAMFIGLLTPYFRGEGAARRGIVGALAAAASVGIALAGFPSWSIIGATVVAATVGVTLR